MTPPVHARRDVAPVDGRFAPQPSSDASLLVRLRDDDSEALDLLMERYWAPLFRYVHRRTESRDSAADVVQDVFVRLWQRRAGWRVEGSVRGLLFRLARNAVVSGHRRARARQRILQLASSTFTRSVDAVSGEDAELRRELSRAIDALPRRRREVFLLRMVDGLSYDEIGNVMGTSPQTVANQLSRALATLRRTLVHLLD